jgi:hypothetical protein
LLARSQGAAAIARNCLASGEQRQLPIRLSTQNEKRRRGAAIAPRRRRSVFPVLGGPELASHHGERRITP